MSFGSRAQLLCLSSASSIMPNPSSPAASSLWARVFANAVATIAVSILITPVRFLTSSARPTSKAGCL